MSPATHTLRLALRTLERSTHLQFSNDVSSGPAHLLSAIPRLTWDAWRATRGSYEGIAARQRDRLQELIDFTRSNSRYYRELYRRLPERITDIRQLPRVTKPEMMAHFDDWITDPRITRVKVEAFAADASRVGQRFLDRYTIWTTSGSTGMPALLVQDEHALSVMASLAWARAVPAWIGGDEVSAFLTRGIRGALVFATGGHFMALSMAERARQSGSWARALGRIMPVTLPTPELVRQLNEWNPTLLVSYASGLVLLAEEQAAGRLHINPVLILSTGESLPADNRRKIEMAFGGRLRETYGASEIQIAAFECRMGRLHVNADWVVLEPVDSSYEPVLPGEPSHTVLATSLSNFVQPIIRYDLGDRITVLPERCDCGSPLPSIRVEGRSDEILCFRSASGRDVHVLPAALATSVAEIAGLQRFQLYGKGADKLVVRLQPMTGADPEQVWTISHKNLRSLMDAHGLENVAIERSPDQPTANPRSGKFRQVWAEAA